MSHPGPSTSPALEAIARTLVTLLDNQQARVDAALEDLPDTLLDTSPDEHEGDAACKPIRAIGHHLLGLRRFQLTVLDSPLVGQAPLRGVWAKRPKNRVFGLLGAFGPPGGGGGTHPDNLATEKFKGASSNG